MNQELREAVARAIFDAEENYDCLWADDDSIRASTYRDADAAIAVATPIIRKQVMDHFAECFGGAPTGWVPSYPTVQTMIDEWVSQHLEDTHWIRTYQPREK